MKPRIRSNHPYYSDELALGDYANVIRGIYVGGCVDERNSWSVWESARSHAHNASKSEWLGWICVLKPEDVLTPSGRPTAVMMHELAHLLCPDQKHSRAWKRAVTELGAGQEIERCGFTRLA